MPLRYWATHLSDPGSKLSPPGKIPEATANESPAREELARARRPEGQRSALRTVTEDTPEGRENQPRPRDEAGRAEIEARRVELYVHGAMAPRYARFPALAGDWVRELAETGLRTYGAKVAGYPAFPPDQDVGGKVFPVTLHNGQRLWLRLQPAFRDEPRLDGREFFRVEVRGETSPTAKAMLAALAVLEGAGAERVDEARMRRYLRAEREPDADPDAEPGADAEALAAEAGWGGGEDRLLAFGRTLLWHHHPEVDQASDRGIEMLIETCKRVAAVAKDARHLADYLEFGAAGRDTRQRVEDAQMDVYAAELHHIARMSQPEVATKLGLREQTEREKDKHEHRQAANMIRRGTGLLTQALGGAEGFHGYVEGQRRVYSRGR